MSSSVEELSQQVRCHCRGNRSLDILKEVQTAYEDRLERIERLGGADTHKLMASTLRSWVNDLLGQNQLLVKTVEDLELVTSRTLLEARKHQEMMQETKTEMSALRRRMARRNDDNYALLEVIRRMRDCDTSPGNIIKFCDVTEKDIFGPIQCRKESASQLTVIQDLQKDNARKDKEIEKLTSEVLQARKALGCLKREMSDVNLFDYPSTNDVGVMVDLCVCSDNESQLSLRSLRELNMDLSDDVNGLKKICVKLELDNIEMAKRNKFCDAIIKEMTQQLKKAKDKHPSESVRKHSGALTEDRRMPRLKTKLPKPTTMGPTVYPKSDPDLSKPRLDGAGDNI